MESTKTGEYVSPEGPIEVPERKICPILMAGAMITEIHTQTGHTTTHNVLHEPALCIGDKCEWFKNGCPAHPKPQYYQP